MEKLIVIAVIVGASIIHSWLKRRQDEAAEKAAEEMPPRRTAPRGAAPPPVHRPQPAGGNWEAELRRLLHGEGPSPVSPPVVHEHAAPPAPPPLPTAHQRPVGHSSPFPGLSRQTFPPPEAEPETEGGLAARPGSFLHASAAHERVGRLQASVAQRMHQTSELLTSHAGWAAPGRSARTGPHARDLFATREAQRSAILASVILGPPRAVEPV